LRRHAYRCTMLRDDGLCLFGISLESKNVRAPAHSVKVHTHLNYIHISALALKWHPDKNMDKPDESSQMMQKINAARDACEKKLSGAVEQPQQVDSDSDTETAQETQKKSNKTRRQAKP